MSAHEFSSEPCTKTQAIAALAAASFYSEDEDRFLTHSFLNGSFGADWDFMRAAHVIEEADSVMWTDGFAGHDLEVVTTDKKAFPNGRATGRVLRYLFQVSRPAVVVA